VNKILKIIVVAGARPNFMKIAPLIGELKKHRLKNDLSLLFVHTGQHYDVLMSQVFFRELNIPEPDINLGVGSASHAKQTAAVMDRFEDVCLFEKPDWVVVVGDVNSTMACTLVATKLLIKVAHVEAGLRSFDRTMPEEINRIVTDSLADLLLTPSRDADENLLREGIPREKIEFVGNIMIDSLKMNLSKARSKKTYRRYFLIPKNYVYVTIHRPSNVDEPNKLKKIMNILENFSHSYPIIFPVHPRTKKMLEKINYNFKNNHRFIIVEPVGYHDSLCLVEQAKFIITDSGGLQEESTYLRVPCLTLRENTERPVTISQGTNRLTSLDRLEKDIEAVLGWSSNRFQIPAFWDGNTAKRIVRSLFSYSIY
jgi:UDP-N-acetylglucosamine 2-epimerase (non-hydrolysing)